jgi:peptidoglycan hydrolase-like protein with peptidoglycan-binding domain
MKAALVIDGIFGPKTEAVVSAFQLAHKDKVLAPWGISTPTGIFYKTTLVEAKNIMCPTVTLPIPTDLIPWSANTLQVPPKA